MGCNDANRISCPQSLLKLAARLSQRQKRTAMEGDRARLFSGGKPTIDDVASLAGVSRTTVSRVLNNGPNVRPGLRDKVRIAVDALGFKVNVQARNLAGR